MKNIYSLSLFIIVSNLSNRAVLIIFIKLNTHWFIILIQALFILYGRALTFKGIHWRIIFLEKQTKVFYFRLGECNGFYKNHYKLQLNCASFFQYNSEIFFQYIWQYSENFSIAKSTPCSKFSKDCSFHKKYF